MAISNVYQVGLGEKSLGASCPPISYDSKTELEISNDASLMFIWASFP